MEEKSTTFMQMAYDQWDPQVFVLAMIPLGILLLVACIYFYLGIKKSRAERALIAEAEAASVEGLRSVDVPSVAGTAETATEKVSEPTWTERLRSGLAKTRQALSLSLSSIFHGEPLNDQLLEKLHESLYRADIGVQATTRLINRVRTSLMGQPSVSWNDVKSCLRGEIFKIFSEAMPPTSGEITAKPWVVLVVGVNGAGKTTSIGKLASHFRSSGKSVLLCAADTFRAAAIDQLQIWAERAGVELVKHQQGSDPAAVAFDGVKAARARGMDVVLVDTAGRLQAKETLMAELAKIRRVISKEIPDAPHECWLVLDATTGQNAVSQLKIFQEVAKVSGIVMTKLDGTAKGGVLVGLIEQFKVPIKYVGVGEKINDLREFDVATYVDSLFE